MQYTADETYIMDTVQEEISRVAAASYSEDGSSLYDAIVLHSNDENTIQGIKSDAFSTIVTRFARIATPQEGLVIDFELPDLDPSNENIVCRELDRYVALRVCADWLQQKHSNTATEYDTRAVASIEKAAQLIYSRKAPKRW